MSHSCHAHGCCARVPPNMVMCRPHWFKVRKPVRDAIWREYRQGQENDKQPSLRYLAVQHLAISEVAFKPHDEAAATAAAPYLLQSEYYRAQAFRSGLGDPLLGLSSRPPMDDETFAAYERLMKNRAS